MSVGRASRLPQQIPRRLDAAGRITLRVEACGPDHRVALVEQGLGQSVTELHETACGGALEFDPEHRVAGEDHHQITTRIGG